MNTYLLFMLSEIRKDKKKLIKDPIKRMSYNGSGSAREVVRMIALALGFKIHEDEYGISAYGGNAIRIADHCTYMQTWVDRGTWNAPIRLDVVIEEEPTQAVTQVKKGYDFTIVEFVYDIIDVDTQNARTIAYDIRNVINGNQYANNARGERRALKSTHNSNENKQYNKNRNIKRTIKLRESELKRMIAESVRRLINETDEEDYEEFKNYVMNIYNFLLKAERFLDGYEHDGRWLYTSGLLHTAIVDCIYEFKEYIESSEWEHSGDEMF